MRFTLLIVLLSLFSNISCWAQFSIRDEIRENPYYSGSNNVRYADSIPISYTPVPKGKKAFYISHYGRHGSSFLIHKKYYDLPFSVLLLHQTDSDYWMPLRLCPVRRLLLFLEAAVSC